MCYHKSEKFNLNDLELYYQSVYSEFVEQNFQEHYHVNGFDFQPSAIIAAQQPKEIQLYNWGLVPWWVKGRKEAEMMRLKTLNCISEEAYDKPAFRDSLNDGKRCLVPASGFFEWRWGDAAGKRKYPYYIFVKDQPIFSMGGIHSRWVDTETGEVIYSYSILTTKANPMMEKIHNNKKRMPVIIPREFEQDWLNAKLTKDDVLALCQPLDQNKMDAHTITKLITARDRDTDVPEVLTKAEYPELALLDS